MSKISLKINIKAPTIKEEFENLTYVLGHKAFYDSNGYKVSYPDTDELRNPELLDKPDELLSIFKHKEYDPDYYTQGLAVLNKKKESIEEQINKLLDLQQYWGFKYYPEYLVLLTRYGYSERYITENGNIFILTNREGHFGRPIPSHTIINEIVHLGIEESIVKRYGLVQWEKERVVDLFIKKFFQNEISGYETMSMRGTKLDKYITDMKSLNKDIEKYKDDQIN